MIKKIILRDAIKDILLQNLLDGKTAPDERLSLPEIARELETSVTPVREALTQLTETGIVTYKANRGFFVTNLSRDEAIELYNVISLLEGEAIRKSNFKKSQISNLSKLNNLFRSAENTKDRIYYDALFHQKIIENYQNSFAKKVIEDIRTRISIHELKFMDMTSIEQSATMHHKIITALKSGNLEAAKEELNANWLISIDAITKQTLT